MMTTLDSIDGLVKSNKELVPAIQSTLAGAGVFTADVASTLSSTQGVASQITTSLDGLIGSGSTYMDSVSEQMDNVFGALSNDAEAVSNKLAKIETINQKIKSVNNVVIGILDKIKTNLGVDCSKALSALNSANEKQDAIINKIDSIRDNITKTGNLPANAKAELETLVGNANTELSSAATEFSAIRQNIDAVISDSFSALDDITGFLQTVSAGTGQLDTVFDSALDTTANLRTALKNLKTFLSTVNGKIYAMIEKVKDVESSNLIENIITPIIENPEALGSFVSSPVAYDTTRVYPIEN